VLQQFYKENMESTKLQTLDKNLPLRAFPEEILNKAIVMDFLPFISNLLSLSSESSAERLEIALPAIKEHCIGMGFAEITKMFKMYADSKLSITPIPNYFDRILLGKIVSEYKSLNKKKEIFVEEIPTEDEQEKIMQDAVMRLYLDFKNTNVVPPGNTHIYDYLYSKGKLPKHTKEFKDDISKRAKAIAKQQIELNPYKDPSLRNKVKETIKAIDKGEGLKSISKRLVLEQYFKNQ
jgi:hypothetical protein